MTVKASVIISIFNQPKALSFSLIGYQRQSVKDFELIIADDGSDDETRELINNFKKTCDFEIKHIWQENRGFRKAKIVNEAVKISVGKCLILSDGDCIPHNNFVKYHLENHLPNSFCVGGYVRLPLEYCNSLNNDMVFRGNYERFLTLDKQLRFYWIHFKNLLYIAIKKQRRPKAYGCNISCDRETYYTINGYDENFDGFGKIESDLRNRLVMFGAKPISLWHKAFVFHLDHNIDVKRASHIPRDRAKAREYYNRKNISARCKNGLIKSFDNNEY